MTLLHLQLFWGESQNTFLGLNSLPTLSDRQESELKQWSRSRRKILRHEAHSQPWIKVGSNGESTQITLKPSGRATETNLFGSQASKGNWSIQDGFLFIVLENDEKITEYRVIGNADNNIHSGAEYVDGKPYSLVKLVQVKPH